MKQMAERTHQLEQYKNLCERRIKDLDPNHHLPVQPDHIGLRPI